MPPVTVQDVAEYAPGAPAVTAGQLAEAQDWAEEQVGVQALPVVNTRQWRFLKRAISAYALALATGLKASTARTSTAAAAAKKIKVGPIELERSSVTSESQAQGFELSAEGWLERAELALRSAGLAGRGFAFAGVSR